MDIQSIHQRIEQLCKQKGWSYYRLAKEAGFQQSTLKSITTEKYMPSLYTLNKICIALNITMSDFFDTSIFNYNNNEKQLFISLWNELPPEDREKVLIYMHGLLHKEIRKEDSNDL